MFRRFLHFCRSLEPLPAFLSARPWFSLGGFLRRNERPGVTESALELSLGPACPQVGDVLRNVASDALQFGGILSCRSSPVLPSVIY